jgi:hypothetical protein
MIWEETRLVGVYEVFDMVEGVFINNFLKKFPKDG